MEAFVIIYIVGIFMCAFSNGILKCRDDLKNNGNIFSNIVATYTGITTGIYGGLFWPMMLPIVFFTRIYHSPRFSIKN